MLIRVLASALASAILMFLWGFVYWGPVLNMTPKVMAPLPPDYELDFLAPMRASKLADGMYVYPGPLSDAGDEVAVEQWEKKVREGPIVHMTYHAGGVSPMDPGMMLKGFAHSFVIGLLAALLLATVVHALPTFASRFGVLTLVVVLASIWTNVGQVIWRFTPTSYAFGEIAYELVGGLLMALATATIIRPQPAVKHA